MENANGITKADPKVALAALNKEIVEEPTEAMRRNQTNPLREFHRYSKGQQIRWPSLESRDALKIEQLAVIRERLLHLESPPALDCLK
jgi:hypothetical protein